MTTPTPLATTPLIHTGNVRSDEEIWTGLLDELRWNAEVDPTEIGVVVEDGVVTLTGRVDGYLKKWAVQEAIFRIQGVRAIINDIRVGPIFAGPNLEAELTRNAVDTLRMELEVQASYFGSTLLRGLAALVCGLVTMFAPRLSLPGLVLLFGVYAFVEGALALLGAMPEGETQEQRWLMVLQGVGGVVAAVIALTRPALSGLALSYLIAAWAQLTGVLEIVTATVSYKRRRGEWLLIPRGLMSIALGVVLVLFPEPGATMLVLGAGVYALTSGVMLVGTATQLRSARVS